MDLTSTVLGIIFDNSCLILHGIVNVQLHQITLYVAYNYGRIAHIHDLAYIHELGKVKVSLHIKLHSMQLMIMVGQHIFQLPTRPRNNCHTIYELGKVQQALYSKIYSKQTIQHLFTSCINIFSIHIKRKILVLNGLLMLHYQYWTSGKY